MHPTCHLQSLLPSNMCFKEISDHAFHGLHRCGRAFCGRRCGTLGLLGPKSLQNLLRDLRSPHITYDILLASLYGLASCPCAVPGEFIGLCSPLHAYQALKELIPRLAARGDPHSRGSLAARRAATHLVPRIRSQSYKRRLGRRIERKARMTTSISIIFNHFQSISRGF